MLIVAVMTVRRAALDEFRRFEHIAARVMARYCGAIERTIELDGDASTVRELHVVRFPDEAAFEAYRADPELTAHRLLRDASVIDTEVWRGKDGPRYGT
jgi:hypothetical protein